MTPATLRALRRGLLGFALTVVVAVGWTLRRPGARVARSLQASPMPRVGKEETRTTGLVFRSFKQGSQSFVLEAESSVGREETGFRLGRVRLKFNYTDNSKGTGRQGTSTIASDECDYDPKIARAIFRGHVVLKTDDGFELGSESLTYRGDKGVAKTDAPVEFRRKDISGSSRGAVYSAQDGAVELSADVKVRILGEGGSPAEIESRQAFLDRADGTLRFEGDVHATQGRDALRAERLVLSFEPETQVVLRAVAAGGVDLRTQGGTSMPGLLPTEGKGPRELKARKLDVAFRSDRSVEQIIAQNDVDLLLLPGPGEPRDRRRVKAARHLIFDCDGQGRVVAVRGQKDVLLEAEPLEKGGLVRTVRCRRFEGEIEPDTGKVKTADFAEEVVFTRAGQRAAGSQAHYDGTASVLTLTGGPEVEDERGTLSARTIALGTESGDVKAEGEVRHVLKSRKGHPGLFGSGGALTFLSCRAFSSLSKARTATYSGDGLLRSGKDEVRAETIAIQEDASGRRELDATGSVVSILNPRSNDPGAKPPAAVEGRADAMKYDERGNAVVYTGSAVIRQGDIVTRSPGATLTLTADGKGIQTMVAGEPVEVQQGDRHASGTRGTYTPGDETMVLVGENAVLQDPKQQSRGRSLTFHVGDDRILVEGQDEGRTETIFQNEPRRP